MRNRKYPLYQLEMYESFNEMVLCKAKKLKNKVAFQYREKTQIINVSYKQFFEDVVKVGQYFNECFGTDKHIGILGENSYFWLVAFSAAVMSNNIAVLLDKELKVQELETLFETSKTNICVCSYQYWDISEEIIRDKKDIKFIPIQMIFNIANKEFDYEKIISKWNKELDIHKNAAIFFTSGTSGNSKGVMLSQSNMISDINMACKNFVLKGTVLAVLPFHHAFGLLTAVFKPFNYEHPVYINSNLKSIKKDMLFAKPQTMMLVPLFVEIFHKMIWQTAKENGKEKNLKVALLFSQILLFIGIDIRKYIFHTVLKSFGGNLEYIICGGATLQEDYIKTFRQFGIEILNGYGITECSPVIAVNRNHYYRDGSVGTIIQGCDVRIHNNKNSNDSIGEIQVKGPNVMLGYFQNDKETESAFDAGWFKTGDLGYIDKDGFLYITGRKKNLIILPNGENVSPEELEAVILKIPYVKEVIVSASDNVIQADIFMDYDIESNANEKIKEDMKAINKALPGYKKIARTVIRENEFEKTTTKKIKRV